LQTVKQNIAKTIVEQKVSILEVMTHLEEISSIIQAKLADEFDNLGLECQKFFIESINAEDKDLESLKAAKQQYASTIFEARGKAASREIQGFDYRTERQFDVLEGAAKNQGAGNVMAPGMGLGMGLGVGRVVSGEMENTAKAMRTETSTEKPAGTVKCPDCGFENKVGSKFCNNCGAKLSSEKFCPNCGAKYQEGQKFCGECGEKL